ncbi:thiamine-phosphate kinase [Thalassoglobus polymorphus]|uniref:Thiamine-monophosphate kinase n=1 Tax=Thalassoglobus polymorphus TaxID=2527994 RepID=A0A517QN40_9PLAN|nr:thiamine-phosphate kinase [Thalassoglobus polymorphus]QDT33043.1 Thiamine-monophosphate kinase [Thalassoglobus polymorphus]
MNAYSESRPEFDFIDWIKKQVTLRPEVKLGIGDDAAILSHQPNREWVTAIDVITEGVHFTSETPPELIGRKALAINLSDIAAMAADPVAVFLGIVLPKSCGRAYAEQLYAGIFEMANEYELSIAGGDTNSWSGPLVLNVTVMGTVEQGKAILRSGANAGDWIFVTGPLGGSLASGRHLTFEPKLKEAKILAQHFHITSMLDLSDGLASDARHIASQSGVGMIVDTQSLPIHTDVNPDLPEAERVQHAMSDGEDFELLLTVSPEEGERLLSEGIQLGVAVTKIGECTEEVGMKLQSGDALIDWPRGGWEHEV